jgi:ribosomal protein S18 acetylase RimI-like enzyme
MSLVTHTENPAQRLYRRMGFEETERRVDPRYLELVGIAGRVLMVKRLGKDAPSRAAAGLGSCHSERTECR